jgi:hypothetical protein
MNNLRFHLFQKKMVNMDRKILIIPVIIILGVVIILVIPKPAPQTGFQSDMLAENLNMPWAMDFLPNGTMIFTQRGGVVSLLDNGVKNIGHINVTANGESGLLGVAVDPEFSQNKYIYLILHIFKWKQGFKICFRWQIRKRDSTDR